MPVTIKPETMEALVPLFEEGLKPKQIQERLAETPDGLQLAASTIGWYAKKWRNQGTGAEPEAAKKAEAEKQAKADAEAKVAAQPKPEPQPAPPKAPEQPTGAAEIREFCAKFPGQCDTLFAKLGEKVSQMGVEVQQGVTTAIQEAMTPKPVGPEPEHAEAQVDDDTVNRVLSQIGIVPLVQWEAGHLPACPNCKEVARNQPEQLITPLESMLKTVRGLTGKEEPHEGSSEGRQGPSEAEAERAEHSDGGKTGGEGGQEEPAGGASSEVKPEESPSEEGSPGGAKPDPEPKPEPESKPNGNRWGPWAVG